MVGEYKGKVLIDGKRKTKKVSACPFIIYDPSLEESGMANWIKAHAVDESGTPTLFGEEKILTKFEERRCKLRMDYEQATWGHKKDSYKVFVTDYRLILTLPAKDSPVHIHGGAIGVGTSFLKIAVKTAKQASARKDTGGFAVYNGYYTNFVRGKIKLDKKNENYKVQLFFYSPAQPFGKNAEFYPDGLWHEPAHIHVEIENFPSEAEATEFINQVYAKSIEVKLRHFDWIKNQGRLSPTTTEDTILKVLNDAQADPIQEKKKKEINYWILQPIDTLPFLPTPLEPFGLGEPPEKEFSVDSKTQLPGVRQFKYKKEMGFETIYARK